jgi:hypothetical protein
MTELKLFVQVQGDPGVIEVAVAETITGAELHDALSRAGVSIAPELFVFVDEAEDHIPHDSGQNVPGLQHGGRIHVARCHRIKTTVHYLERTIERTFSPGARVRSVKKWAAHEFHLDHKDAAEHVLQICNSKDRPASDTPLHFLTHDHVCAVCFDLVPEKRIEG